MKTIEINGRTFELIRKRDADDVYAWEKRAIRCAGDDLYKHYSRPSIYKEEIYADWREWYCECPDVDWFGVCSANAQQFSITALHENNRGETLGVIYITRDHNRYITFKEQ